LNYFYLVYVPNIIYEKLFVDLKFKFKRVFFYLLMLLVEGKKYKLKIFNFSKNYKEKITYNQQTE
jgi:hypothetical protein